MNLPSLYEIRSESYANALSYATRSAAYIQSLNMVDVEFTSGHSLELFFASSREQRIKGLANLAEIPSDGMLFYYSVATYKPFTMKDMAFDLDIGWYDKQGKLLDVQEHKAGEKDPVVTSHKFNYVIEAVSGMLPFSDLRLD